MTEAQQVIVENENQLKAAEKAVFVLLKIIKAECAKEGNFNKRSRENSDFWGTVGLNAVTLRNRLNGLLDRLKVT